MNKERFQNEGEERLQDVGGREPKEDQGDHVASVPKCCAVEGCKKRSMIWCTKCRRYLCLKKGVNCFWSYHNMP